MSIKHVTSAIVAAYCLTTGCAPQRGQGQEHVASATIAFGDLRTSVAAVADPKSAEEAIACAVALSHDDKHAEAGALFSAAARLSGPDGKFARACLASAAQEYILDGAFDNFKRSVRELRQSFTAYERMAPPKEYEALLRLDGVTSPAQLRDFLANCEARDQKSHR